MSQNETSMDDEIRSLLDHLLSEVELMEAPDKSDIAIFALNFEHGWEHHAHTGNEPHPNTTLAFKLGWAARTKWLNESAILRNARKYQTAPALDVVAQQPQPITLRILAKMTILRLETKWLRFRIWALRVWGRWRGFED